MIIIAVDTSGSISDDKMETGRIVGEILRMTVTYNCWEDRDVEIIYCGTRLRKDGPFKASSAELDAYIEKIKKNGIKASNCDTDLLPIWKKHYKRKRVGKWISFRSCLRDRSGDFKRR